MNFSQETSSDMQMTPGHFRIVRVRRGELITGFRVQECRWSRANQESAWYNVGRQVYSMEAATDLLEFTQRQRSMRMLPEAQYEEVFPAPKGWDRV